MRNNLGYKGGKEVQNLDKDKCDLSHNYFDCGRESPAIGLRQETVHVLRALYLPHAQPCRVLRRLILKLRRSWDPPN